MYRLPRPRSPLHLARQVVAALLVAGAVVLAVRPPPAAAPVAVAPATRPAVVTTHDLPAGAPLVAADLAVRDVPLALLPAGVLADPAPAVGRVTAGPVRAGEVLTDLRLVGPPLWASVGPGQVAAPVRLADVAVAGLLRPGDRVDVLATSPDDGTAEVVAAGALVLGAPGPPGDVPGPDPSGLLVLAVPPDTAARLAAAAATADLTVTLGQN